MICGEVIFMTKDGQSGSVRLNSVATSQFNKIPVALIGKAQQGLQLNFFKKMEDPDVQVLDVVIMNIFHLGHMTPAEFHKPPEGTVLQEVAVGEAPVN